MFCVEISRSRQALACRAIVQERHQAELLGVYKTLHTGMRAGLDTAGALATIPRSIILMHRGIASQPPWTRWSWAYFEHDNKHRTQRQRPIHPYSRSKSMVPSLCPPSRTRYESHLRVQPEQSHHPTGCVAHRYFDKSTAY